jgi:Fe-S cluster biogenesis protein NfuA
MFIQTETTPNPASLKFIPDGIEVAGSGAYEFKSKVQAFGKSILAEKLFDVDGVGSVFLGSNFVTINKNDDKEWDDIKTEILTAMMDFFLSKKPVISKIQDVVEDVEDDDVVKQIKELIEMKVRPAVAMDGGDIIYRGFKDGVVELQLKGSCSGCPSSTITLKSGIENMLKHYIPEVESVEQVEDDAL